MRITKTTIIGLVLILGFIVFALISTQTCKGQGVYTFQQQYTAKQQEIIVSIHGEQWETIWLTPLIKEAIKNHFNTTHEQYKQRTASMTIDREDLMTPQEKAGFKRLLDSLKTRKAAEEKAAELEAQKEVQREIGAIEKPSNAVHVATIKGLDETGHFGTQIYESDKETFYIRNGVGKSYSERLDFIDGWTSGGGSMGHGFERGFGEALGKLAIYTVVAAGVLVLIIYGIIQLAK